MKYNIPINKGNYSMDTIERERLFEVHRGKGWEKEYQEYRENWIKYAKRKILMQYPLLVDLELSTACNLHCPMCYTITEEFGQRVHRGFMSFNLFRKIIDEIKCEVPAIRLSLRGEPTLHPQFLECIHYAKSAGIREISHLTNGSRLEPEFFEKMLLAGVDWITISVDGLKDQYEQIRMPLKFEDTLRKIKEIKRIKERYQVDKPVIKIQSIWPAIREDVEQFYNLFQDYVDLIAFNPLIDYLDNDEDIIYDEDFSCPQLYQRLIIGSDGKAVACSNDEMGRICVGNANESSIFDIWHGDELTKLRKIHNTEGGFKHIELCRLCYLPRKTEDNERGRINGREFIIKNYIGRSQIIGK